MTHEDRPECLSDLANSIERHIDQWVRTMPADMRKFDTAAENQARKAKEE